MHCVIHIFTAIYASIICAIFGFILNENMTSSLLHVSHLGIEVDINFRAGNLVDCNSDMLGRGAYTYVSLR